MSKLPQRLNSQKPEPPATTQEISAYVIHAMRFPAMIQKMLVEVEAFNVLQGVHEDGVLERQFSAAIRALQTLAFEIVEHEMVGDHVEGVAKRNAAYREGWAPKNRTSELCGQLASDRGTGGAIVTQRAEDFVGCPDVQDPEAFAARVHGDSMTPKYQPGDIVIFSPAVAARTGDDCFVRFADGETTFKTVHFERDNVGAAEIRLMPRNEKYRAQVFTPEQITATYVAVYKYVSVRD